MYSVDNCLIRAGRRAICQEEGVPFAAPLEKGQYLRVLLFPSARHAPIEVGVAPVRWVIGEQFGVELITLSPRDP